MKDEASFHLAKASFHLAIGLTTWFEQQNATDEAAMEAMMLVMASIIRHNIKDGNFALASALISNKIAEIAKEMSDETFG
jgi:hypothetical protein